MKKKGSFFRHKLALGLIFTLTLTYSVYHLITMFGEDISTYAAGVTTESMVLNYNGYLFREETVLTSSYGGVVDYHVENGIKVAKGQALSTVYQNGDAQSRAEIRQLDDAIAVLRTSLEGFTSTTDIGVAKEEVSNRYVSLVKLLADRQAGGLSYQRNQFLIGLNQMSALTEGEEAPSYETLRGLEEQRDALLGAGGESRTYAAPQSGYFYSETDGYEGLFTADAAKNMSGNAFYKLITKEPADTSKDYGKISYTSEWYFVLPIAIEEQRYFEVGEVYDGTFEESQVTLPLTVERIVEVPDEGSALIVFLCDRLPEHFSFDRCQSLRVEVAKVSGIYVPKSVVERQDGGRGVYVLRGSVVHFRYIDIVYEGSDYYLVRQDVEDEEDRTYLKVNDLIILNGKNMFDGRILD